MTVPIEARGRRIGIVVVTTVFALFCLSSWWQVIAKVLGIGGEVPIVALWHLFGGGAAYAAAVGAFRRRPWAWQAAFVWAIAMSSLIISLGPILMLDEQERMGLPAGAIAVLLMGTGMALYLRSAIRRPAGTPAPPAP